MMKYFKTNILLLIMLFSLFSCKSAFSENKNLPNSGNNSNTVTSNSDYGMLDLQGKLHAIAKNEAASVVNVGTEIKVTQQNVDPFDFFFGNPFNQNPKNNQKNQNQQKQYTQNALGSGVLYRKNNNTYYIVTNNHVIDKADKIKVTIGENKPYDAKLIGTDPDNDIAVISIDTKDNLKLARFGDSNNLSAGDIVIAIGNPFGLSGTMTMGIISALGRNDIGAGETRSLTDFIQTDASINPGNSGGSLMNINGEVIGINTLIYSQSGGNIGIGFAIPINVAKKIADEFIDKGKSSIEHGYLGVSFQEVTEDQAKTLDLKNFSYGMLVASVFEGSPAEKSGIKAGDLLVELNGKPLKKSSDLTMTVGNSSPGTKFTFKVLRDNQTMDISVVLGNRTELSKQINDQSSNSSTLADYGFQISDLNNSNRTTYKIPANVTGALVTSVSQGSPAFSAGLTEGDVIYKVNSKKIGNSSDLIKVLNDNKDNQNYFFILRQGKELITRF
jgi:serine protease Do